MSLIRDLPLNKNLLKALDKLGFIEATEVQAQAIPAILDGYDVTVSAKTGSGKTAAFLLPMLDHMLRVDGNRLATRGLILLPTRELALQTQQVLKSLAAFTYIKAGLVIGGEAFKHQVASLRKNPEIIIATPGRLVEHIEKGTLDFNDLEFLVLDEADRMLDMGFAEDMNTIANQCRQERQNLLFSATLKHTKIGSILEQFNKPKSIVVDTLQNNQLITQQVILADDIKHKEKLVCAIISEENVTKVFVFCKTRAQCQQLGNYLKYKKLRVEYIHGEIAQSERKQIMNRFRDGHLEVLVATDVAARGLDIDNVDLVINFTLAQSGDDHVHRVGRTGRAGKTGVAINLVSDVEWQPMASIERYLNIRFKHRKIKGLEANYKGPKKLKNSGKAAGVKNKKKSVSSKTDKKIASKKKTAAKKPTSITNKTTPINPDGFAPLRRKK